MAPGSPAGALTLPDHALPPATPRPPQSSPDSFSHGGAGKPNRKLSAHAGPRLQSTARAQDGPGGREPRHVTSGCPRVPQTWNPPSGFSWGSAPPSGIERFYSLWLLAEERLIGCCPPRPLSFGQSYWCLAVGTVLIFQK